uniref:Rho guanine nucleotide exchange factor 28 n=1 Tax=Varanus komodoensis TaxID=61221 RepID=A0A8D2IWC0_VARKO
MLIFQGQITIYGKFDDVLQEDAEFYFVYSGSKQRHVAFAKCISDNTLESVVPGKLEQEDVSVCVVMYKEEGMLVTLGSSSVTYKQDTAGELAWYLVSQVDCLTPSSHHTLLQRLGLTADGVQLVDHDAMLAVAHEEIPPTWSIVGSSSNNDTIHKETILHLTMRFGLVQLSQFLLFQPGGTIAITLPNEDGLTPLDLALQNGHFRLADIFSKKQVSHPFEISKVLLGEDAALQFAHSSGILSLTCNHTADHLLESDVQLFRKYFWDRAFLHKVSAKLQYKEKITCFSIIHFIPVQRHFLFETYKKTSTPSTSFAVGRLPAMLNGSDEVYANRMVVDQVGVTVIRLRLIIMDFLLEYTKILKQMIFTSTTTTILFILFVPIFLPKRQNDYEKVTLVIYHSCVLSSSLDDLDVDNGDGRISNLSHKCYPSMSFNSSVTLAGIRDGLNSSETAAELDFNMSRAESFPLSSNPQAKESLLSGVRSRSYSYTAPKVALGKPHCARDFTICDSNDGEQISIFITRIQEEDWDKYIIPTKSESEKYKVSRTFSFLMSRMASTRNKSKAKNKDAKEKEKLNKHQFVNGTFTGVMPCFSCEKPLLGKESLQCSYCNAILHKSCKDCAPACTKVNPSFRDVPQPTFSTTHPSTPIGLSALKKDVLQPPLSLSKSVPSTGFERKCVSSLESDTDTSSWRSRSHSEELLQSIGTALPVDSFILEDDVDASLWSDLSTDASEFEAESWSLVVDPSFCSRQEKDVIKRQDVIFELMQTEVHHIHTLFIMSKIFRKGMKEELQLDHSTVDKIFPCLDELQELHQQFFYSMKERRQESAQEGSDRNFVISRIGDILVQQFSEENANKMKSIYGEFCSHQKEAVTLFKELQQNKKFQNFIKLRNSNLLARRRGIPECILLVTQRITKYPVLVERILQYTKEGTEEHRDLCEALGLIKEMIAAVDLQVNEYEKKQKLLEILNRIENKTYTKLKNGHVFRKQDLIKKQRTLLHEGLVYWKTATGRFKDILALLLSDVMLFLQEKDQKYIFAAVDQKPAVIALQKLIVREVANEERGMFLISASSTGPEMYEIHTSSKEERSHWMRQVQEAVESCPEEEGKMDESDEDRRVAEARAAKIQKCQAILSNQDQQICNFLEEKLGIYAKLGDMSGFEDVHVEPHLLIKPDSGEIPQVSSLLAAALKEGKAATLCTCHSVVQTIQNLTRLLYSIQAALTIQDTHIEIHKLLLQEHERSSRAHGSRGTSLPEQEKHRNFKSKEELVNIHKLQQQFQQEQQRWHRECEQRQQECEGRESRLLEKEKECLSQEKLLCKNRRELDLQLQDYQQNLERLRESQRLVQKEREMVKLQQQILHHWKHSRQSSLPVVISSGNNEIMGCNKLDSFCGENSVFINEAMVQMSLNRLNRSNSALVYQDSVHGASLPNTDLSRTTENLANLNMDISCQQVTSTGNLSKSAGLCHSTPSSSTSHTDAFNNRKC